MCFRFGVFLSIFWFFASFDVWPNTSHVSTRGTSLFYAMSSSSGGEEDDKFYWDGRAKDSDAYLGEDVFKVEAIRRRRIREGETEYLIKWLGWES